jgi:hypothetical protein
MRRMSVAIFLSLCMGGALLQAAPRQAYVRQVDYIVESLEGDQCTLQAQSLFMLYLGNPETERIDSAISPGGATWSLSLVHPVSEQSGFPVAGSGTSQKAAARNRWYVTETDTARNVMRSGPLMDRSVWRTIPVLARSVLLALGPDDEDLILIAWNGISGSLSVFYTPKVQTDRTFYERKLEVLRGYMVEHGSQDDVPYERIDASEGLLAQVATRG